jgi:hypothetical protein
MRARNHAMSVTENPRETLAAKQSDIAGKSKNSATQDEINSF